VSKNIATAIITDPALVTVECSSRGIEAHSGAIWCNIPELGFIGSDLIYCRYGLSFPYLRIQPGWRLLVEPTLSYDQDERWFFTGLVDGGGPSFDTNDQLLIQLLSQVIYGSTAGTLHLSKKDATEPFVLGNKFLTWVQNFITSIFNDHTHNGVTTGSGISGKPVVGGSSPTDILSTKIFGE